LYPSLLSKVEAVVEEIKERHAYWGAKPILSAGNKYAL